MLRPGAMSSPPSPNYQISTSIAMPRPQGSSPRFGQLEVKCKCKCIRSTVLWVGWGPAALQRSIQWTLHIAIHPSDDDSYSSRFNRYDIAALPAGQVCNMQDGACI